jgi:phosphatidylserine/phosphatidylglycerophosphate/cardiolipin synthase-like enzyme
MTSCLAKTGFSPKGNGLQLILELIDSADSEIRMQTYSFTHPLIGDALLKAHKRGVDIKIIVDEDHNGKKVGSSVAGFLAANGVDVKWTKSYAIQHNKVIIVDRKMVETGSFNFSKAAQERNAENVLIIYNCPQLAQPYLQDWQKVYLTGQPVIPNY